MENKKDIIVRILFALIVICILIIVAITKPNDLKPPVVQICKEDSLREVIYQLQNDLEIEEDGWDKKENRYEDIIFEYEYGLNHLKESHSDAYREFHRIIGYRERYSQQLEKENKIRLNKW